MENGIKGPRVVAQIVVVFGRLHSGPGRASQALWVAVRTGRRLGYCLRACGWRLALQVWAENWTQLLDKGRNGGLG